MELIRRRGDADQAERLEAWLGIVVEQFGERILPLDADAAQVWGRLRVPDPDHALDKQIAAIALVNDLTLATRNVADFRGLGVRLRNPFVPESAANRRQSFPMAPRPSTTQPASRRGRSSGNEGARDTVFQGRRWCC